MKELLKIIGMLIWVLGGGMIIGCVFMLPILAVILVLENSIWLLNYVSEIIIAIVIALALICGFSKKANDPLHW